MKKPVKQTIFFITLLLYSQQLTAQTTVKASSWGGKSQLKHFITQELFYPEAIREKGTEGIVEILLTISSTGKITNMAVVSPTPSELNNEALKIAKMLLWTPAQIRGIPVESKNIITIPFKRKQYQKTIKRRGYDKPPSSPTASDTTAEIHQYRYLNVAPFPLFTESNMTLEKFLENNFIYPDAALHQNIRGVVRVQFIVETTGRLSNIRVTKTLGGGCNEEALRLVRLLHYYPGLKDGKAVRTLMHIDISFGKSSFRL